MMVAAVQGPSRDESGGQTPAGRGQTDNCLLMVSSPHCVPTMEKILLKVECFFRSLNVQHVIRGFCWMGIFNSAKSLFSVSCQRKSNFTMNSVF